MKSILVTIITLYKKIFSFDGSLLSSLGIITRPRCVYHPTCSVYAMQAIEKYGARKGAWLGVKRILSCHPWQTRHIDPLV